MWGVIVWILIITLGSLCPVYAQNVISQTTHNLPCANCHTQHYSESGGVPSGAGTLGPYDYLLLQTNDNSFCYRCHPSALRTYTGSITYEDSIHATHPNATDGTHPFGLCLNCHNPHGVNNGSGAPFADLTTAKQENLCYSYNCHSAGGTNSYGGTDIYNKFNSTTNHHPVSDADQSGTSARIVECVSCHNTHLVDQINSTTTSQIVYPDDTTTKWFIQSDVTAADYDTKGIYKFCQKCHVDSTTTEPIIANATVPYTIKMAPSESNYNYFDAAQYNDPKGGKKNRHGASTDHVEDEFWLGATGNEVTYYNPYPPMPCTDCHDPHGSNHRWQIKDNVNGITASYDLYTIEGQRIFCGACHSTGMGATENEICTNCHRHGKHF